MRRLKDKRFLDSKKEDMHESRTACRQEIDRPDLILVVMGFYFRSVAGFHVRRFRKMRMDQRTPAFVIIRVQMEQRSVNDREQQ